MTRVPHTRLERMIISGSEPRRVLALLALPHVAGN